MPTQIPDDMFLAFLEAAAFEDEQLGLGAAIEPAEVARTAGQDLATVRSCVERLVAEGLGYVPKDEPEGFQIDAKRVGFAIRRLHRAAASPPAGQPGSMYNVQITGSTIASLATGPHARAVGEIHVPTSGGPSLQGSGAPPAVAAHAQGSQSVASDGDAPIDFAILTAIEVERRAVCAAFGLGDDHRVRKGSRVYWRGRLPLKNGEAYELVVAQSPDMANVDAALLTSDMLHHWAPGAALMVGIAASTKPGEVKLGDVVAGSDVYYYERGKVTPKGTKPEPKMVPADATLWSNVTALPKWTAKLPTKRPDGTKVRPKVHLGVIASGEKVLADESVRDQIAAGHRKILALEMEGYGFSKAVWQSFDQVRHLVIRSICDDGSEKKDDRWHQYAAAVAAGFAKHLLLDRPLTSRGALTVGTNRTGNGKLSPMLLPMLREVETVLGESLAQNQAILSPLLRPRVSAREILRIQKRIWTVAENPRSVLNFEEWDGKLQGIMGQHRGHEQVLAIVADLREALRTIYSVFYEWAEEAERERRLILKRNVAEQLLDLVDLGEGPARATRKYLDNLRSCVGHAMSAVGRLRVAVAHVESELETA